ALFVPLAVADGCSSNTAHSGNSNTNWLRTCEEDDDCGRGLACLCGTCTLGCSVLADCSPLGERAKCASVVAELTACSPSARPASSLCLSTCSASSPCGAGQACIAGTCVTTNLGVEAGVGGTSGSGGGPAVDSGSGGASGVPENDGGVAT